MDKEEAIAKPHVLVITWPTQGHINPALALAMCLASKSLLVTIIMTTKVSNSAKFDSLCSSLATENISDGSEEVKEPESPDDFFKRFQAVFSQNLTKFIDSMTCPAKVIIYDSMMPWVLDIAHERGLLGASFFTTSCAVCAIFYHLKQGLLRFPYEDSLVTLPSLPTLEIKDLPCLPQSIDPKQTVMTVLADQLSNLEKVDWMFVNTFDKLEKEVVDWMASQRPIMTVGPTNLLQQKDERFSDNKNHKMINLIEPKQEACREWLDTRETGSVVYISFGSLACVGKEQMEELAFGLMMSNCYFLWVVRSSEVDKLPQDFTSLALEKGLIIDWCNQEQVLAHRALGCFMTHCGWNSTLEALSYGVPLISMSQWADQKTNAKFIEDVWRVGVGVKAGENGVVGREEIAMCVKEVIGGDKGIEVKKNACKFKNLANEAVEKCGSTDNNIEDFVSRIM